MFHSVKDYLKTKKLNFDDYAPDIPQSGIFDDPVRCYKINDRWAVIVMGMVSWLLDPDLWKDATDERYIAIQEISKFLQGMECMSFELRQNPTNMCLIEQSFDGGQTWSTAFDLSACQSIVDGSQTVINNQQYSEYFNNYFQDVYNDYVNNYVNDPTDVYPDLAYGVGNDAALDAAYCNAVYTLVSASADVAISGIQEIDELQSEFNIGIAITGFILTAIALAGALPTAGASLAALGGVATLWGASVGITATVANNLLNQWQNSTIDQYQDTAAIFEVTCFLVNNVSGDTYDSGSFSAALLNHGLTGNAAVIADNLRILIQETPTKAAFLEKWNNNLQYAQAGIELFCPCGGGAYYVDFTTGNAGDWQISAGTLAGGGVVSEPAGQPEAIIVLLKSTVAWSANRYEITYVRESDGSFLDDLRIIGWTSEQLGTGRIDVYERDEPIHGQQEITLCIDTTSTAKREDWGVYLRDNNAGATITLKSIKVWSDIDPLPFTDNSSAGCS